MNDERIAGTFVGMVWKAGEHVSRCKISYRDDPKHVPVEVTVTGNDRGQLMQDAAKALDIALDMRADVMKQSETIFGSAA